MEDIGPIQEWVRSYPIRDLMDCILAMSAQLYEKLVIQTKTNPELL